jgi:FkbM family methyltransferase
MSLFRTLDFIVSHPLNKKRLSKALVGYLKWQIGSRLVPGEVIYNWIEGSKFIVKPGEKGLTQNIYCGLHEFEEMAYVLHVLNSEDLFIDVGANAGVYTILACGVKGAWGYCFEPIPSTFSRLAANIRINEMTERVKAYNIGLADKEGELLFTSGLDTTNHVIYADERASAAIKVEVLPLDKILFGESPALVKIDVEGFETLVVNGMPKTLENPSLHSVILELNDSGRKYGFEDEALIEKMTGYGFRMYIYEPFDRILNPIATKNTNSSNTLFLRNVEMIHTRLVNAPRIKIGSREV